MDRPLWVRKLSNDKLKQLLDKVEKLQMLGSTDDEDLINLSETWYDNHVGMERFMRLSIDIWKEAAYRWSDCYEE